MLRRKDFDHRQKAYYYNRCFEAIPYFNTVAQNVGKYRCQRGWTREELVLKLQLLGCNITSPILSHIETRRCIVTDIQIVFFSEVFSVSIRDLYPSMLAFSKKSQKST